ncbi:hypothetical protein J5J86_21615 [Aquabacter sp. L1I39]|uniref:hypothetical protein n=1 Tax=Aquabacter sp. L1I39 TaxID=2820278 RepID=UPI001AD97CED|nr:hypothetical protein [Aquabacter sp. L1I39]QTL03309.1 hypothetical protein J5J86_21615 [Aquabacter sp. L1I39]
MADDILASILTGLRVNFLHPEGLPSALILDVSTDEGDQRFVLPCDPDLSPEDVEAIGDDLMACLDRLIAASDEEDEEEEETDSEDRGED